ncbi:MAG: AsmA family protein [Acidobacteria bacterium]|nr:AsmA family protein [Acidobacteriota bacterium]
MKSISRKILWAVILTTTTVSVAVAHTLGSKTAKKIFPVKMRKIFSFTGQLKEQSEMADTIKKSFPVGQGGSLTVKSSIGTVEVEAADTNTVNIEVVRRIKADNRQDADEVISNLQLDFQHRDKDVQVLVKLPEEWGWDKIKRIRLDFKISVPRAYNVSVQTVGIIKTNDLAGAVDLSTAGFSLTTGNVRGSVNLSSAGGPIRIGNVAGPMTISSAGGSVKMGDVQGMVDVASAGGSVRMGSVDGDLDVRSGGGLVSAGRVDGHVKVNSSGGYIHIAEVTKAIEAVSLGGEVKTYFSRQPQSDSSFLTSGGSVNLRLADSAGVSVDVNTGPGSVVSDYPLSKVREITGSVFTGDLNGGGPKVTIRTAAGHLTLRRENGSNAKSRH